MKHRPLKARNFPTAVEDAAKAKKPPSLYDGPGSAYHLAFTDIDFLLQEELRPVRMQLELMKPEMVQARHGIGAEKRHQRRVLRSKQDDLVRRRQRRAWTGWPGIHDARGRAEQREDDLPDTDARAGVHRPREVASRSA